MRFHSVRVPRDPACPACGTRTITALIDYDEFCGVPGAHEPEGDTVQELTPVELQRMIEDGADFTLIDVREPYEWDIARLPAARLIPLGALAGELSSIDGTRDVVVYCRSGKRGGDAARMMRAAGFRVSNLAGGILRWSDDVDDRVPRY